MKFIRKFFLNRVPLEEIDTKFLLNRFSIEDLSESDLKFLFRKFNKEIRNYYIEQDLPAYKIKQSDKKTMESLSALYQSSDYKTFVRLLCNKKNSVAKANLKKAPTTEYPDVYWKGYYRGQSYLISHTLALIKFVHNKWMEIEDEKGDK